MNPNNVSCSWCRAWCAAALVLLSLLTGATRAAEVPKKFFDLPAGEALVTLKLFVAQSGVQLLYSAEEAEGVKMWPVQGTSTAFDAIRALAGVPLPPEVTVRGRNALPLLRGEPGAKWDNDFYAEYAVS